MTHLRYTLPLTTGDDVDVVSARLFTLGALGVWETPDGLVAWFEHREEDVPPGGTWEVEPDVDWQAAWKATIEPVEAGPFTVVPTWLADDHAPRDDEHTIVLDPGRAFGSGHHATTTQCLELLAALDLAGARVLDVGCGTGVLAIGAALAGAATVVAVDVDPDAVEVTLENAARNGVELTAGVGSVPPPAAAVAALGGQPRAEVVLANIITDTLLELARPLADAVAGGGHLVASGIAAERADEVVAALTAAHLQVRELRERDGWAALLATRPTTQEEPA
ncbi:MAG: 50S ribosomal protein L11 methyltransferase [Actinomycetes bacterium]